MLSKGLRTSFLFLFAASVCLANQIYDVTIDTSSLSQGSLGAIYFQFNGGLNPDPASISITKFTVGAPGGLTSTPAPFTDSPTAVTGSLDSLPLTIDNSTGLNDYEHYLTYGPNVFFEVVFNLPATLTGDSGSLFGFGLTSDDGLTPVLTQDPSGFNGEISYDQTGAFTVDTLQNDSIETIVPAVPEPATGLLLASALALCWRFRRR